MNSNDAVNLMLQVIAKDNEARRKRLPTLSPAQKAYTESQIETTEKLETELRELQSQHSGGVSESDLKPLFAKWKLAAMQALSGAYAGEKQAPLGSRSYLGAAFSYVVVGAGLERLLAVEAPKPKETVPA